jgi:hypothetical protein
MLSKMEYKMSDTLDDKINAAQAELKQKEHDLAALEEQRYAEKRRLRCITVADLIAALQKLPPDTPIEEYDDREFRWVAKLTDLDLEYSKSEGVLWYVTNQHGMDHYTPDDTRYLDGTRAKGWDRD